MISKPIFLIKGPIGSYVTTKYQRKPYVGIAMVLPY